MNLKIGILVPFSNGYPTMGRDFIDGLEMALSGLPYEIFIESIGVGANMEQIIGSVQKLLNQNRVHVLTGLLGHHLLQQLVEFTDKMEAVLLYSDLGATIPVRLKKKPTIFCNSFDLSLASIQTANCMIKRGFNNVAVSTCYYDAGYGFVDAMGRALYRSGGQFAGHFVTPLKPRENEAEIMKHFFEQVKPEAVYAQYSGVFAREHATFLNENSIASQYPFFASYYTVENAILNNYPAIFNNSYCVSTWMMEDTGNENLKFISGYVKDYGRQPNEFSLLGFENGKALANIIKSASKYTLSEIVNILDHIEFNTPRGLFSFNTETHRTTFGQQLWGISLKNGTYSKTCIAKFENQTEIMTEWLNSQEKPVDGWFNAYLC